MCVCVWVCVGSTESGKIVYKFVHTSSPPTSSLDSLYLQQSVFGFDDCVGDTGRSRDHFVRRMVEHVMVIQEEIVIVPTAIVVELMMVVGVYLFVGGRVRGRFWRRVAVIRFDFNCDFG